MEFPLKKSKFASSGLLFCCIAALIFVPPTAANLTFHFFKHTRLAPYLKYIHGVDIFIACALFVVFKFKLYQKMLFDKSVYLLIGFLLTARISLLFQNVNFFKSHSELLKLFATCSVYFLFLIKEIDKKKILKGFLLAVMIIATFQCIVGIGQFFLQAPLGLKFLGETTFSRDLGSTASVCIPSKYFFLRYLICANHDFFIRAHGLFFHPNIFAGFLCISILVNLHLLAVNEKYRKTLFLLLVVQFFTLILTFSRAGFFAGIISGSIWFFYMLKKDRKILKILSIVIVIFLGNMLLMFSAIKDRGGIINYYKKNAAADSIRIKQQNVAFKMIKAHPYLGVGFRNFIMNIKYYDDKPYRDNAHNIFLVVAAEEGIAGLILFMGFVFIWAYRNFKNRQNPLAVLFLASIIALGFIGMVDHYLITREIGRILLFGALGSSLLVFLEEKANQLPVTNKKASLYQE